MNSALRITLVLLPSALAAVVDAKEAAASHILVKTEAEAKEIKAAIAGGESFEKMAAAKSSCPSRSKGGALGTFAPGKFRFPVLLTCLFGLVFICFLSTCQV